MAPASLPAWRPQKTLIDLYNERDQTPWYLRTTATLSAMLLMIGFLIMPSAFSDDSKSPATQSTEVALITSLVLIILSTLGSSLLTFLTVSWLFHLDVIYIPHFTSSVLGVVNIVYNLAANPTIKLQGRAALAIALAAGAMLGHALSALWVFRKIHIVREREAMHRHVSPASNAFALPENDLQRQQLLRLLSTSHESKAGSPLEHDAQATYKIQWPGGNNAMLASRRNTVHTIRNLPFSRSRFGNSRHNSQYHASSPGRMSHYQPQDIGGGVERVPDVILEEPTMSGSRSHEVSSFSKPNSKSNPNSISNPNPTTDLDPTSPRPAVHNPLLPAFFEHHPGERVPSYHPRPATYVYAPTPSSAGPMRHSTLGPNGFRYQKPEEESEPFESIKGHRPPLPNSTVVDGVREARAGTPGTPGRAQ